MTAPGRRDVMLLGGSAPWNRLPDERLFAAAKEYRDAEWALRILDGEGCNRLDPRWNAAVDRWRAADAAVAAALGDSSPFA